MLHKHFLQRFNSFSIAANTDTSYYTNQRPAFEFAKRIAKSVVHCRLRNRLQPVTGHMRELLVAKQRNQRRYGIFSTNNTQQTAGIHLFLDFCIGFNHGNKLVHLLLSRRYHGLSERLHPAGKQQGDNKHIFYF